MGDNHHERSDGDVAGDDPASEREQTEEATEEGGRGEQSRKEEELEEEAGFDEVFCQEREEQAEEEQVDVVEEDIEERDDARRSHSAYEIENGAVEPHEGHRPSRRQAGQRDAPDEQGRHRVPRDERAHTDAAPEKTGRAGGEAGLEPKPARDRSDPEDDLERRISGLIEILNVVRGEQQWCVVVAECLSVLRCLPAGLVDHVITDPPYSKEVHARSIRRAYLPDTKDQPCRKTRAHAFGFESLDPEVQRECSVLFAALAKRWRITFSDMETADSWRTLAGADYVRTCAWVKDRAMPQISGDRPGSRVELMTVSHRAGKKSWNAGGDGNVYQCPVVVNCSGHRQDRVHTAQKPVDLMLDLVRDFTDEGDIILDPFAGSGTTGVAALRLGRRAILIEQNADFAAIAIERMQAEERGQGHAEWRAKQEVLFG